MRKFIFSFGVIWTVAAAAFIGGCNKNNDCSCDKDKAAVKTDAQATPAAKSCTGSCSGDKSKCSGSCSGDKKTCPATGASAQ
jgi:hypothetical protein